MDWTVGNLAGSSLRFLLLKGVDQLDGREEPDMRLTRAGAADQDDVIGVVEEVAAMKLLHERFIDLAAGEVEAVQIAIDRKACGLELCEFSSKRDFAAAQISLSAAASSSSFAGTLRAAS